ncbi:hypothetical protein V3391_02570 [Luteimonas sp. SMYT11W]|uniref:Uncharacterized protein n=1 Tax=Luteimonas flava TaxID=3115822 RepID=A0ABU7WC82_9GAMM
MDAYSLVIVALMAAGLLIVVATPAWIALLIAWRSQIPRKHWRSFAFTCLLLAYGFITFAGAALMPLGIAQIFVAPQLISAGHEKLGTAIFMAAEHGVPIVCLLSGLLASFVVPLKLRKHWAAVANAVCATNSFKPNPLRGSA